MLRCLFLLLALMPAAANATSHLDPREAGRSMTKAFYAHDIDTVWQRMNAPLKAALKSAANLGAFRDQIDAQLGAERELVDEAVRAEGMNQIYLRQARFERFSGLILVQWAFAADGSIAGFFVRPSQSPEQAPAASQYLDYQTKSRLSLPFDGEFFVFWGGRTVGENYHAIDPNQRFAMDMLVMKNGSSHGDRGLRNEDYYCFGAAILAPAGGVAIDVVDDVPDNTPGQMNAQVVTGNRVIIDHGNGEYSVLAHMRHGSIAVKKGQQIRPGQPLGECGNSGNSSEPHLHFQLQDGAQFGTSMGLPAQFANYLADAKLVARGEPIRGQLIKKEAP